MFRFFSNNGEEYTRSGPAGCFGVGNTMDIQVSLGHNSPVEKGELRFFLVCPVNWRTKPVFERRVASWEIADLRVRTAAGSLHRVDVSFRDEALAAVNVLHCAVAGAPRPKIDRRFCREPSANRSEGQALGATF